MGPHNRRAGGTRTASPQRTNVSRQSSCGPGAPPVGGQAAHRRQPARRHAVGHPGAARRGNTVGALARRHPASPLRPSVPRLASSPRAIHGWLARWLIRTGSGSPRPSLVPVSCSSTTAPRPTLARLLLDAAVDARRLGHTHAMPAPLLRAVTLALWREDHGHVRPPVGWFTTALAYASRPLRSDDGVRALIPSTTPTPPTRIPAMTPSPAVRAGRLPRTTPHPHPRRATLCRPGVEALHTHTSQAGDLSAPANAAGRPGGRYGQVERLTVDARSLDSRSAYWPGKPPSGSSGRSPVRGRGAAGARPATWGHRDGC
jgi:hypothetical protein